MNDSWTVRFVMLFVATIIAGYLIGLALFASGELFRWLL